MTDELKQFCEEAKLRWKKRRLRSFIRKHSIVSDYVYDGLTHESMMVALMKTKTYGIVMVDVVYSKDYLEISFSKPPESIQKGEWKPSGESLWWIRPSGSLYDFKYDKKVMGDDENKDNVV